MRLDLLKKKKTGNSGGLLPKASQLPSTRHVLGFSPYGGLMVKGNDPKANTPRQGPGCQCYQAFECIMFASAKVKPRLNTAESLPSREPTLSTQCLHSRADCAGPFGAPLGLQRPEYCRHSSFGGTKVAVCHM